MITLLEEKSLRRTMVTPIYNEDTNHYKTVEAAHTHNDVLLFFRGHADVIAECPPGLIARMRMVTRRQGCCGCMACNDTNAGTVLTKLKRFASCKVHYFPDNHDLSDISQEVLHASSSSTISVRAFTGQKQQKEGDAHS